MILSMAVFPFAKVTYSYIGNTSPLKHLIHTDTVGVLFHVNYDMNLFLNLALAL